MAHSVKMGFALSSAEGLALSVAEVFNGGEK
jgi:hypothetical protein